MGSPLIELDVSSRSTHGQRGSGFSANVAASNGVWAITITIGSPGLARTIPRGTQVLVFRFADWRRCRRLMSGGLPRLHDCFYVGGRRWNARMDLSDLMQKSDMTA